MEQVLGRSGDAAAVSVDCSSNSSLTVLLFSDVARPADGEVEEKFQQCRQYVELNERLQEARGQLLRQREELRAAGERLKKEVAEVEGQTL